MNPALRTIENIVEHNLHYCPNVTGKKLFQIVKYVTGKNKNDHVDYEIEKHNQYYGFIRVTLEPLFQEI